VKKQTNVALSSCEAETMDGTKCGQGVKYCCNLLLQLVGRGASLEKLLPVHVTGDKVSLSLAQNNPIGQRRKHMNRLVVDHVVKLQHIIGKASEAGQCGQMDSGTK